MDSLYLLRERIEELYADYSRIVDKAVQFVVTLLAFYLINANVGFMEAAASPVITVVLSVICTFFQPIWTLLVAAVLILAHMYALSIGVLGVVALVFIVMYVFFIRMTPNMALVVLLTPILFHFHIPFVLPVACGLLVGPVSMVAIGSGIIIYYMLNYVKVASSTLQAESMSEIMNQVTVFIRQIFTDREMWIYILTFMICILVVYAIHRLSIDHAWVIAIAVGVVVNIVVIAGGDVALGVSTSYGSLFFGNLIAAVVGLILMFFFFSVDYGRSENLQYEDDDYYYYVKAVPKLSVSKPDVTVKRINARRDTDFIGDDTDEEDLEARNILASRKNSADSSALGKETEEKPAGGQTETDKTDSAKADTARTGTSQAETARTGASRTGTGTGRTGSSTNTRKSGSGTTRKSSSTSGTTRKSSSGTTTRRSSSGTAKKSSTGTGTVRKSGTGSTARKSGSTDGSQSSAKTSKKKTDNTPEVEDVNETLLDMSLREDLKLK